jgi:DNA-binding XRE family transcriptional regulator
LTHDPSHPVRKRRDDAEDADIWCKIRALRLQLGRPQSTLAKAIGPASRQAQKHETGASRVSPERLQQIAKFLGVPLGKRGRRP